MDLHIQFTFSATGIVKMNWLAAAGSRGTSSHQQHPDNPYGTFLVSMIEISIRNLLMCPT